MSNAVFSVALDGDDHQAVKTSRRISIRKFNLGRTEIVLLRLLPNRIERIYALAPAKQDVIDVVCVQGEV